MADVDYEVATKFTGEDDLRRGATAFENMGDSARRALDDIEQKARGGLGLLNLEAGINLASQAFSALSGAASTAMAALSEGAALSDARGDFADLSAEINTTAETMETRLAQATGGLITNAQLISDASNLMALNLGLTEDEIVAFSGAAAELDWNMEALADTLNTGATRGLKEMGLNIADVKARMAELEAQGIATDKAFRMAILEAAEEKIGRVGKKSEEAAGQIQKVQVAIQDAGDAFKEAFAEGATAGMSAAVQQAEQLEQAMRDVGVTAGGLAGQFGATAAFQFANEATFRRIKEMGGDLEGVNRQIRAMREEKGGSLIELGFDPKDAEIAAAAYEILVAELERLERVQRLIDPRMEFEPPPPAAFQGLRDYTDELARFVQLSNQGASTPPPMAYSDTYFQDTYGSLVQVNQALVDQSAYARDTADAWAAYTDALTSRGGDYFADFLSEAQQATEAGRRWAFDLNQAIFDAANQEGAGADFLSGFAENIGARGQEIAAALEAAQQQALTIDLAAGVREAGIAWSEFPAIVEQAIAELEGKQAAVAPLPIDERGFRQVIDSIPKEPIEIPLEVQLREDLIDAAVANARGMVDGFIHPDQAYQAVMDMDISAIETGSAQATQMINSIPRQRTITINWEQSGTDVIAALRALGVIP